MRAAVLIALAPAIVWPRFAIETRTLRADRSGRVAVAVACPSRTPAPRGCAGSLTLARAGTRLARASVDLRRGEHATLRLRLGPATRARLARARRLHATLKADLADLVPRRVTVTLLAAPS